MDRQLRLGGVYQAGSKDPDRLVRYCQEMGFAAAYDPGVKDRTQLEEIKTAFAEHDIVISETGAYAINILEPDAAQRERNIAEICRRLERAEQAGARCCVAHGGSATAGRWGTHSPANFSQETFDTTVATIQRIIDTVKPATTSLCLETESRVLPDNPQVYLALIEAVDRPQFKAHLDPVNITSDPRRFYFNGSFIRECFARLGPHIVSCHAKDLQMVPGVQVHFEETFAGNGDLDYGAYLTELVALSQDAPLMIEHVTARQQRWARDHIYAQAAAAGVALRQPGAPAAGR